MTLRKPTLISKGIRRPFYTEMLPELKARGKTLIVVSHDDSCFDAADRVTHMENGRIVEVSQTQEVAALVLRRRKERPSQLDANASSSGQPVGG